MRRTPEQPFLLLFLNTVETFVKILCPFWFLLMFIFLFFMSCDNVMMMCISLLFIKLSSNQVCFHYQPFLLFLGTWVGFPVFINPLMFCSLFTQLHAPRNAQPLAFPCPATDLNLPKPVHQPNTSHPKLPILDFNLSTILHKLHLLIPFAQPLCIVFLPLLLQL